MVDGHIPDLPAAAGFYQRAMRALASAEVPFLVGGAYGMERLAGVTRDSKDIDLFVRRGDHARALDALSRAGYRVEVTFGHWLGKAWSDGGDFVDVLFSSGNGIAEVDDAWFEHAFEAEVLGVPVLICPPEETIWSKAFIMERERFDGADVLHILRARADALDWQRLIARFAAHWRVLLAHLVLFGFVYPSERTRVPAWVMTHLAGQAMDEAAIPYERRVCRGTLLSREQYLVDLARWEYSDPRLVPEGTLTAAEVAEWTRAIHRR